jgi:hypothetical protein
VPDAPEFLRVANWDRYQIHHDGRPMKFFAVQAISDPKNGRIGVLDDPAFLTLADEPDCPVFRLFAYAAQTGNKIPNNPEFLAAKLFASHGVNLKKLMDAGVLEPHPDSVQIRTEAYATVPRVEESRAEEKREELQPVDACAERDIFDSWLSCSPPLIAHRASYFDDRLRRRIKGAIERYGPGDVAAAVANYAAVLASPDHYWSHRWPLGEFLQRGLDKFVPEADPVTNFRTKTNGRGGGLTPAQILALDGGDL